MSPTPVINADVPRSQSIRTIAWNPTGHLIATGAADKTLRIWNPDRPQVKNSTELRGHTSGIEQVAWNPVKESELVSVSLDGTVRFWDVRSKGCIETVKLDSEGLSLSWAMDGSMVMAGSRKDETLHPISTPSFTPHAPLPQYSQTNQTLFAPSHPSSTHHTLLHSTGSGSVKISTYPRQPTPTSTLSTLHTLHSHTSSCSPLALAPNGRYLATGGSDALICLWDTSEWTCNRTLDKMVGGVRSLSFSFDGAFVVGGSEEDKGLEVAHVESGEYVFGIPTGGTAGCVAWHPSRYWIAYAGEGGLRIVGAGGGQL
ncbi:MAG: hypothetical protein MMC23_003965 [Stictis urceolatum]|nr:hypothetical protein [Stictis urceolata]